MQAFIPAANKFDSTLFHHSNTNDTMAPVTSQFYNLQDSMSLMTRKNHKHINTALPKQNENAVCDFTGRHFTSGCYCASVIKIAEWENICVGTRSGSSTSAPSAHPVTIISSSSPALLYISTTPPAWTGPWLLSQWCSNSSQTVLCLTQ